jgi:hypothetical protein
MYDTTVYHYSLEPFWTMPLLSYSVVGGTSAVSYIVISGASVLGTRRTHGLEPGLSEADLAARRYRYP